MKLYWWWSLSVKTWSEGLTTPSSLLILLITVLLSISILCANYKRQIHIHHLCSHELTPGGRWTAHGSGSGDGRYCHCVDKWDNRISEVSSDLLKITQLLVNEPGYNSDLHSTFTLLHCYFLWGSKFVLGKKKSFLCFLETIFIIWLSQTQCQSIPYMYFCCMHLLKVMFVKAEALSWSVFPKQISRILRINYCMLLHMIAVIYFTWGQNLNYLVSLIKISRWLTYTILGTNGIKIKWINKHN
jgi:hypothetical protein